MNVNGNQASEYDVREEFTSRPNRASNNLPEVRGRSSRSGINPRMPQNPKIS